MIALEERRGKALNDSELLRRARGRYALLLNEDSELLPGATLALYEALRGTSRQRLRGRGAAAPRREQPALRLGLPDGRDGLRGSAVPAQPASPCRARAIRPGKSTGASRPRCSSGAAAAEQVGYLDPDFFVYSDEVDFARRLRDVSWYSLYVPAAVAIHHEQLSTDAVPERRIVELSRNRDLYMRKHHSATRRARLALADRLDLRPARARRARAARPFAAALLAARDRDAASGARRGTARGRGGVQPARGPEQSGPSGRRATTAARHRREAT